MKTPQRIDALGMILVLALLVWRLMERSLRTSIKNTGQLLTGWDNKKTDKPTAFMMTTAIVGIQVLLTKEGGRHLLREPAKRPREFLLALGLDESVFTDCRYRCSPVIPGKQG